MKKNNLLRGVLLALLICLLLCPAALADGVDLSRNGSITLKLTDGKGSFFAITDTKGAVHCILYNTGRGLLGAYFRETGEYKVYDEQKNIDNYLNSYASYIDSVISTVIGSAAMNPWSQQVIDSNLTE